MGTHLVHSPPVSSIRIASSSSIHAVRLESSCCGGIASSWLWVFCSNWGVINVNEGERKEVKFTPSPCRFLPPFVDSPVVSPIHLLPHREVLLRHRGALIRRREVLPCRRRVLPHHASVLAGSVHRLVGVLGVFVVHSMVFVSVVERVLGAV